MANKPTRSRPRTSAKTTQKKKADHVTSRRRAPATTRAAPPPAAERPAPTALTGVDVFMANLSHPQKPAIEALRDIIRSADAAIIEDVKWNAPSYRTSEYFATMHLRPDQPVGLVLHLGAKAREDPNLEIADPDRLLQWLARDRAIVRFADLDAVRARTAALQRILRQWIVYV